VAQGAAVHPRAGGEPSCWRDLNLLPDSIVNHPTAMRRAFHCLTDERRSACAGDTRGTGSAGNVTSGAKSSSRNPSRSTGTRRFRPQVLHVGAYPTAGHSPGVPTVVTHVGAGPHLKPPDRKAEAEAQSQPR
jgi:hypothetical protein